MFSIIRVPKINIVAISLEIIVKERESKYNVEMAEKKFLVIIIHELND